MRQVSRTAKLILWFVVIAFVVTIFYGWGAGRVTPDEFRTYLAANVDGDHITLDEYRSAYQGYMRRLRDQFKDGLTDDLLQSLQVERSTLEQMINERVILDEARKLGLEASADEIRNVILSSQAFAPGGQFVGSQRYKEILRYSNLTPEEYEFNVGKGIVYEKFVNLVTSSIVVKPEEVRSEYVKDKENVEIEFVEFRRNDYIDRVEMTDEKVAAFFESRKDEFQLPDRRKCQYIRIEEGVLRSQVDIPAADLQAYYDERKDSEFTQRDERRASHILIRGGGPNTPNSEKIAVAAKIKKAQDRIASGEDFSKIAEEMSDDTASAEKGGDLGFFGVGKMVPEFEEAVWALEKGQVSDPVQSPFGAHLIKLTDVRDVYVQSLEEAEPEIRRRLSMELARERADQLAGAIRSDLEAGKTLEEAAARVEEFGIELVQSEFLARGNDTRLIGRSQEFEDRLFSAAVGETVPPMKISGGWLSFQYQEEEAAHEPQLDEVRADVEKKYREEDALRLARLHADEFLSSARKLEDFKAAAEDEELRAVASSPFNRNGFISGLGRPPELMDQVFNLAVGEMGGPVEVPTGFAAYVVTRREGVASEIPAAELESFRRNFLAERGQQRFGAVVTRLRSEREIWVNPDVLPEQAPAGLPSLPSGL